MKSPIPRPVRNLLLATTIAVLTAPTPADAGDERFHDQPDKDSYSHPHYALQYLMAGGGEGRAVLQRHKKNNAPSQTRKKNAYPMFR